MKPLASIVRKELRQHGWVAALLLLTTIVIALLRTSFESGASVVEPWPGMTRVWILMIAFVWAERTVVQVYKRRTQVFLEGLPVSRWLPTLFRIGSGLVVTESLALACTGVFLVVAWREGETIGGWLFFPLMVRTALVAALSWALACFSAMTGRYRPYVFSVGAIVGFMAGLGALTRANAIDGPSFPLWTVPAVLGQVLFYTVATIVLGVVHDGAWSERLARRATLRERLGLATCSLGAAGVVLFVGVTNPPPNRSTHPSRVEVTWMTASGAVHPERQDVEHDLRRTLDGLAKLVGREKLPSVVLSNAPPMHGRSIRSITTPGQVVIRTPLETRADDLQVFVARDILLSATEGAAGLEPRAFFLDGAAHWSAIRRDSRADAVARIAWTQLNGGSPVTTRQIEEWRTIRYQLGPELALALAGSGVATLERLIGADETIALLAFVFRGRSGLIASQNIDDWLSDHTSITTDRWLETWNRELESLAAPDTLSGSIFVTRRDGFMVIGAESSLPGDLRLLHTRIRGAEEDDLEALASQESAVGRTHIELAGRYDLEERVFLALDRWDAELKCHVRLASYLGPLREP
ncbi:MAG: hypothetical protein AAGF12_16255 [Myxococcota bacterium]